MTGELLSRLRETPAQAARLAAEASDGLLDARTGEGWSARTILAHLRDIEFLEMRMLLERMLGEDEPELTFLDAEQWLATRNTTRDEKRYILGDFALQRQATIGILAALRPEDWKRTGKAPSGDTFTVRQLLAGWVEHDKGHIHQIEDALGTTVADFDERWSKASDTEGASGDGRP